MAQILGVFLSDTLDLEAMYGRQLASVATDVIFRKPEAIVDPSEVRCALCWKPAAGAFDVYPNLALAMSIGAGVDKLLAHPGLRPGIEVARVRDPEQAELMAGFAAHEILHHERSFSTLERAAAAREWTRVDVPRPNAATVAILGAGTMGMAIARVLSALGYQVRVASRTPRAGGLDRVRFISGPGAVIEAATGANYLVNVLPLTAETENILDGRLFAALAPGAYLVQIGRGEHLVERDLLEALEDGQLAGASLDVFRQEPLPEDSLYWRHPKIRVSPHVASYAAAEVVAEQVVAAARAVVEGTGSALVVDRTRGY